MFRGFLRGSVLFSCAIALASVARADVPVIESVSVASTVSTHFFDSAPIETNAVDVVFYNPGGAGAGQIDTLTISVSDTQSNVDTVTISGNGFYTIYTNPDSGSPDIGDSIFLVAIQIAAAAQADTLQLVAQDSAGLSDTVFIRFVPDTNPPAALGFTGPADNTETRATSVLFTWSASADTGAGLASYRIQIDTEITFAGGFVVDALNGLSTNTTVLLPANDTYFARVAATDSVGNSETSTTIQLVVDTTSPSVRNLFPAQNHETTAVSIGFSWVAATDLLSGVASQRIQISRTSAFSTLVADSSVGAAAANTTVVLAVNDTYFWRILATDDVGNTATSTDSSFVIDTVAPIATLVFPATDTRATFVGFRWERGDSHSGVASSRLQVSTSSTFATLLYDSNVGAANFAETTLPANDTYFWRIVAADDVGNTSTTSGQQFRVDTALPNQVSLFSPLIGTETKATTIRFVWTAATDTLSGIAQYRIQYDTDGTFTAASLKADSSVGTATETTLSGFFQAGAFYQWRIVSVDNAGNTNAVASQSFLVDTTVPTAAVPLVPADQHDTRISTFTFVWTPSADAGGSGDTHQRFQTSTDSFATVLLDSVVTSATASASLALPADTIYWRIVGADDAGNTSASPVRIVRVDTTCTVTLVSPADSATSDSRPTFIWSGTGVETYVLQIDTSGLFAAGNLVDSFTTNALTSYQPAGYATDTYFWRVIASDRATNLSTSVIRAVRVNTGLVDTFPPDAFVVLFPAAGHETSINNVTFGWNLTADTGTGVAGYVLQADTTGAFTTIVDSRTVSAASNTGTLTLRGTDTYNWRVLAVDAQGNTTVGTSVRTIQIDTVAPNIPILSAPADNLEQASGSVALSWTAGTDTHSGLNRYIVQVSRGNTFATNVVDTSNSTSASTTVVLVVPDTYFWRIISVDDAGNTTASSGRSFVLDTQAPTVATLVSPANAAETNATTITFVWTAGTDAHSGVGGYRVQVSNDSFATIQVDSLVTAATFSASRTLAANDTYAWRIVTVDDVGNTIAAAARTFAVDTRCTVALSSPADSATTDSRPVFIWTGGSAETYVFQISTSNTFAVITQQTVQNTTSFQPAQSTVINSGTYYWRVGAYDRFGNTDTATARFITVDTAVADTTAPVAFSVLFPVAGHETNANPVTFSWNLTTDTGGGVASYTLEVDTAGTFVNLVASSTVSAVTSSASLNLIAGALNWRVRATDAAGNTTVTTSRAITVDSTAPSTVTLVSPIANASTTAVAVRFDWSDGTDALSGLKDYRLQVSTVSTFASTVVDVTQTGASETTPLYTFTDGTYFWRVFSRDDATNTSVTTFDTFIKSAVPGANTAPPSPIQNLLLTSNTNGTISLTWDRSPSNDVAQYNVLFDSGAGVTPTTQITAVPHVSGTNAYSFTTAVLSDSVEYRFLVVVVDSAGVTDSGTLGSATAHSFAAGIANAVVFSPEGGSKLAAGATLVQILARLEGSAAQISAASSLTFQYRRLTTTTWSNMTANGTITGNANPLGASAKDELGNYRFVWNASSDAFTGSDTAEIRAIVTDASSNTSGVFATSVSVRFVSAADTPTQIDTVAVATDSVAQQVLSTNAVSNETVIITNLGDTQTNTVFIPIASFPNQTDTSQVYILTSSYATFAQDATLPFGVVAVGSAFEVTFANGDTLLAGGNVATITMTFRDADLDGFVDGSRVRWANPSFAIYSFSPGVGWEALTRTDFVAPTATTAGIIRARATHFSVFRLVGSGATTSLSGFLVAPNPFRPNDGNDATGRRFDGSAGSGIYFLNLPANVSIEIYSLTGRRVAEFSSTASTGQIQWDVKNAELVDVASGYYLYIVTDRATGERRTGKIAVIR